MNDNSSDEDVELPFERESDNYVLFSKKKPDFDIGSISYISDRLKKNNEKIFSCIINNFFALIIFFKVIFKINNFSFLIFNK